MSPYNPICNFNRNSTHCKSRIITLYDQAALPYDTILCIISVPFFMKDKVLIVEDELIVATDIRKTLERNGIKVIGIARSTEKALELAEKFQPTLALVDIFLKGPLTGIDLAKHLNKKGIPFIYVSANSNQQVLEAAKTTDPYGFIVKPFREKDLLVTIDIARYRHENKIKISDSVSAGESKRKEQPDKSVVGDHQKISTSGSENIIGRSAPMLHVLILYNRWHRLILPC